MPSITRDKDRRDKCRKKPNEGTAVFPDGSLELREISRQINILPSRFLLQRY
jgi:hypothetical protein